MNIPALTVDGIAVHVDGPAPEAGAPVIVMVHGWPDTDRLWDGTVVALRGRYRCVRFTLPGFGGRRPARAFSADELVAFLARVIDAVSPAQPVTLLLHDWGCVFGYEYLARNPTRVERVIGVDIGDANSPAFLRSLTLGQTLMIAGYQLFLALAWFIGGAAGTAMTRTMARALRCPSPVASIDVGMTYPYMIQWTGRFGGYRKLAALAPTQPMLYLYGKRKPFMFHTRPWLEALSSRPGCRALGLSTGHWVMIDAPEPFHAALLEWLDATAASAVRATVG